MITKLKNITFIFENCDSITIDGKYVGYFLVDDLKTSFERIACNCISKTENAGTFAIEIHKDANKERYQFNMTNCKDVKQMTFNRFLCSDITAIQFILEEDYVEDNKIPRADEYSYYVCWTGDSDYYNESQVNYISNDGHLYMTIAKGKSTEDFFNLEEINDSEHIDFHFDMLDTGDKYSNPKRYDEQGDN